MAVSRFQCGQTELTPDDWEQLSAWEYDVKMVMAQAKTNKDFPRKEGENG